MVAKTHTNTNQQQQQQQQPSLATTTPHYTHPQCAAHPPPLPSSLPVTSLWLTIFTHISEDSQIS